MSNKLYFSLEQACDEAPEDPVANYFELNPIGPRDAKLSQIRENVEYALGRGLRVEVHASLETLAACGLKGVEKIGDALIYPGSADQPGYVRLKVARHARRPSAAG